jgi:hypothetical protein
MPPLALQVLFASAVITPNQDVAFMVSVAWVAVNLLMSNFMIRFEDVWQQWTTVLRWVPPPVTDPLPTPAPQQWRWVPHYGATPSAA